MTSNKTKVQNASESLCNEESNNTSPKLGKDQKPADAPKPPEMIEFKRFFTFISVRE